MMTYIFVILSFGTASWNVTRSAEARANKDYSIYAILWMLTAILAEIIQISATMMQMKVF